MLRWAENWRSNHAGQRLKSVFHHYSDATHSKSFGDFPTLGRRFKLELMIFADKNADEFVVPVVLPSERSPDSISQSHSATSTTVCQASGRRRAAAPDARPDA